MRGALTAPPPQQVLLHNYLKSIVWRGSIHVKLKMFTTFVKQAVNDVFFKLEMIVLPYSIIHYKHWYLYDKLRIISI